MAKGPFMEYLRQTVVQTGADTFTEREIATPSNKTEAMAMLIHSIEFSASKWVNTDPTNLDTVQLVVAKNSLTGPKDIADPNCMASYQTKTMLGAIFNALSTSGTPQIKFDPPLLYPKAHLYLSVYTSGFAAIVSGHFRIGYTLEKVSREDFISALVE